MHKEDLLARLYEPKYAGSMSSPSAQGTRGNPTCGDVVEISLRLDSGVVEEARFLTLGCAVAIAASDALCEILEGKSTLQAELIDHHELSERLGAVPEERMHCVMAPLEAMRAALASRIVTQVR